mgnify:CR=1 FL=1
MQFHSTTRLFNVSRHLHQGTKYPQGCTHGMTGAVDA